MRNERVHLAAILLLLGVLACNDLSGLAGKQALPSGIPDPSVYRSPDGAMGLYQAALIAFQGGKGAAGGTGGGRALGPTGTVSSGTFLEYVIDAGLLTDELSSGQLGGTAVEYQAKNINLGAYGQMDARELPSNDDNVLATEVYADLQAIRGSASLGIGALAAYDASAPPALRGYLYALDGYADIFLADFFCSGIPLSTVDFDGGYTYHAGSTTDQVYTDALAKFDTAVALSGDSARILNLARIGAGRALLALGLYDSAAAVVSHVPDGYVYGFPTVTQGTGSGFTPLTLTESDQEGGTGMPFLSSGDPRTTGQSVGTNRFGVEDFVPNKFGGGGTLPVVPITVADWIEARLITAEAALKNPARWGNWLDLLNGLRQTAITPALPRLTDPGVALSGTAADSARVALLFQERAYWLFLTGHRQGDLRRLLRQYHQFFRSQSQVYPAGVYPTGGEQPGYGNAVNAPIPLSESANPLFTGCLSRSA